MTNTQTVDQAKTLWEKTPLPGSKSEDYVQSQIFLELPSDPSRGVGLKELNKESFEKFLTGFKYSLVFINGHLHKEFTNLPSTIKVHSIEHKWGAGHDAFAVMNAAHASQSYKIEVPKGLELEDEILCLQWGDSSDKEKLWHYSHLLWDIGAQAKVKFCELFGSADSSFLIQNATSAFELGDCAYCEHVKILINGVQNKHVGLTTAKVSTEAEFNSFTFSLSGPENRNNLDIELTGKGAHCEVNGLYALKETQRADTHSLITHSSAETTANQLVKGIVTDQGQGVFTGKIVINKDSQQVDSTQLHRGLPLSSKAKIYTRPQLEVYADDVKCAHGATIGGLNPEEKFYLQSRGLSEQAAYQTLAHAFSMEALNKITGKVTKSFCEKELKQEFETQVLGLKE